MKPDQDALLAALDEARRRKIMCGAAAGYGSPRWVKCDLITAAIDGLAEDLTGHRNLFHDQGSTTPPLYKG